jgi:hypothetical protein
MMLDVAPLEPAAIDVGALTPPAQHAMAALAVEAARIEALMGDRPPRERASYLSHMATRETFATLDTTRQVNDFERSITASAIALLTGALVLPGGAATSSSPHDEEMKP